MTNRIGAVFAIWNFENFKPKSTTQRHSLKLNLFYFKSSPYNFILVLLYYPSGQQVSKQKKYGFEVWTFPNHLSDSKIFFDFPRFMALLFSFLNLLKGSQIIRSIIFFLFALVSPLNAISYLFINSYLCLFFVLLIMLPCP